MNIKKGKFDLMETAVQSEERNCVFAINMLENGRIYIEFHGSEEISMVEVDIKELEEIAEMFQSAIPLIKKHFNI